VPEDQQLYQQRRDEFKRQDQERQEAEELEILKAKMAPILARQKLKDQKQRREELLAKAQRERQQEIKRRRRVIHEEVAEAIARSRVWERGRL